MSNGHVCCLLGVCCPPGSQAQIEALASILHEAGREAVESGSTVAAERFGEASRSFVEWKDLGESAREGRMIQARYLLARFDFVPKGVASTIVAVYEPEFRKKFADH